jgi:hypothetical protein
MKKNLKYFGLILLGMMMLSQINIVQPETPQKPATSKTIPLFSRFHTLSIHVRDTITQDSIFHFLADKLKLPVYYYPVRAGKRKYAGVYAGNLVLEPCGPYSNFTYASNDFRAIFFGLTFEPFKSISLSAMGLAERKVQYIEGDDYIYLKDSMLCGDNITISFMDRGQEKIKDYRKMDSLRFDMTTNTENELGIEYVKEIWIGYKDSANLQKWKEIIIPSLLINNEIWRKDDSLNFYFIKSNIKEAQSITFKVRSLEKAKQYLLKNNLFGRSIEHKIELDRTQAFGLLIYLTEED